MQQSPHQYYTPDWKLGQATCYDAETLAATCARLQADPAGFDKQPLATCTRRPMADDERRFLLGEMAACPPDARAATMADHTVQDWRDLLPRFDLPALVLVARQDKVFPWQGPAWAGGRMKQAETVFFEDSGHMLFRNEPENGAAASMLHGPGERTQ